MQHDFYETHSARIHMNRSEYPLDLGGSAD